MIANYFETRKMYNTRMYGMVSSKHTHRIRSAMMTISHQPHGSRFFALQNTLTSEEAIVPVWKITSLHEALLKIFH